MKRQQNIIMLFILLIVTSCTSQQDKAKKTVEAFVAGVKGTASRAELEKYYPDIKYLRRQYFIEDLTIDGCSENDDVVMVNCTNSFHDDTGNLRKVKVHFKVVENGNGEYIITESKNLIILPKAAKRFAELTGALTEKTTDVKLGMRLPNIKAMFDEELERYKNAINNCIEVKYFSWSTDYWGTPNGRVTIKNIVPFDLGVFNYKIEYTNRGLLVGTYVGEAAASLKSGETKSFSFYSSGVTGKANQAQLSFYVPDEAALDMVLDAGYTGKEYKEKYGD